MASTAWNGRKLWLKRQIGIMRINALMWAAAIPLPGVDFWHIFETQVYVQLPCVGCGRAVASYESGYFYKRLWV